MEMYDTMVNFFDPKSIKYLLEKGQQIQKRRKLSIIYHQKKVNTLMHFFLIFSVYEKIKMGSV